MTDFGLFTLFLFLHVGAAIIAFGPTFAFPLIGRMASKDPAHANFAARVNEVLEDKLVIPFAISMPITGVFLIYFGHVNLADRTGWWLGIAIVLYAIAITIAIAIQRPLVQTLVRLTAGGPPPGAGGPPAAGGAPAGGRPMGPPPAVLETVKAIQRNGKILGILIVLLVLLMVVKPQF